MHFCCTFKMWFPIVVLLWSTLAQAVYYVKPVDYSANKCLNRSCLTIDQYTEQASQYFTTGSSFVFLAGNHSLQTFIHLKHISMITFRAEENFSRCNIICRNEVTILCENVTNLLIDGLWFQLHFSKQSQNSSALKIFDSNEVKLAHITFIGCRDLTESYFVRGIYSVAIHSRNSSNTLVMNCIFEMSTGYNGSAIISNGSSIILSGNVFASNIAQHSGGAIYAIDSTLTLDDDAGNFFVSNSAQSCGGAICCINSILNLMRGDNFGNNSDIPSSPERAFAIHNTTHFSNNRAGIGGGICLHSSTATLNGTIMEFLDNNAADRGGGVYLASHYPSRSSMISDMRHLKFIGNAARNSGGAIYGAQEHTLLILGQMNNFSNNYASSEEGGAIYSAFGTIEMRGTSYFANNVVDSEGSALMTSGGAIKVYKGTISLYDVVSFHNNKAMLGGAISLFACSATLKGEEFKFQNNSAEYGGGIHSDISQLIIGAKEIAFSANFANYHGGALAISGFKTVNNIIITITGNFTYNLANVCGGAIYVENERNIVKFKDIILTKNSRSAVCISESSVVFTGFTIITNNGGLFGGGFSSTNSWVVFHDDTQFHNNTALMGGAINSLYGKIFLDGHASFTKNSASKYGGGIYALGSEIIIKHTASFEYNSAQNGGGLYFKSSATFAFQSNAILNMSRNHAFDYGGAIYHEDTTTPIQCNYKNSWINASRYEHQEINTLPLCFIILIGARVDSLIPSTFIHSYSDTAGKDGTFLYGGLLDKCRMNINKQNAQSRIIIPYKMLKENAFNIKGKTSNKSEIISRPYILSFCNTAFSQVTNVRTYRGQTFTISILAIAQGGISTSTLVTAKATSQSAVLKLRDSQVLSDQCTDLSYSLHSAMANEIITLYPDGPCRDTGLARAVVNVTFLPCPPAFTLSISGDQCICEKRLQKYTSNCTIDGEINISRRAGSKFWMDFYYANESYRGLILYSICPIDYCVTKTVQIIGNPDIQCANNRSGMLCGACATNYSLMLGSSRCGECSHTYLALLLPFAAAGIALVAFLSVLRLTVATGMINSVILYANIVQANKSSLLPVSKRNILTVFIAWLNLDLGFETCFYDGMTTYQLTWFQFAFPIYVWVIISLIILSSRYSITVSKLIGQNPIDVLATLLLLSYTKILKLVIEVYAPANLDYPHNETVKVWLKDGNVPYLQSWHLLLTVVTSLVLVFLFLPYTLLLLIGYKLYRFMGRKQLHWLSKLKPLLDSYYAPYKTHTRYWPGFLLLVRCILYIIFSYHSLGAVNKSLLAIIVTFTILVTLAWLSVRIYRNFCTNVIEASVYLNLIMLSAATATDTNSIALIYLLIGIVFITMAGIIVYHFHLQFVLKSRVWLNTKTRMLAVISQLKILATKKMTKAPRGTAPTDSSSHDPHRIVSKTVIELREPLLETDSITT